MTTISPSSRGILEVERAISDARRAQPVIVTGTDAGALTVISAEYAGAHEAKATQMLQDTRHPAVRLMKLAGLLPQALVFPSQDTDLLKVSREAIEGYTQALAESLTPVSEANVPLREAENARVIAFRARFGHEEHLAVIIGEPSKEAAPLVRIHSSCVTGDVFGSLRCDCGSQLHKALAMMRARGSGVVLYLSQEGRGIGIANKLRAYRMQDAGLDTVEANIALGFAADERSFALARNMLESLGIGRVTLVTNNPGKVAALAEQGITVVSREPLVIEATAYNQRYLDAKAQKLGHQF